MKESKDNVKKATACIRKRIITRITRISTKYNGSHYHDLVINKNSILLCALPYTPILLSREQHWQQAR